ncbi:MAG TPA: hypothetical protein V6C81_23330 [Planktothrix sp.]|jgi:hypothetical protein
MSDLIEGLQEARDGLKNKDWRKTQGILRQLFPTSGNNKFIGDLLRAGLGAQKNGEIAQAEILFWLAIDIYESGRDENAEVLTAIQLLADMYKKGDRPADMQNLCDKTFLTVLGAAEGLHRSIKSLTKQLNDSERASR